MLRPRFGMGPGMEERKAMGSSRKKEEQGLDRKKKRARICPIIRKEVL